MKEYKYPANDLNLKPYKINPEIESSQQYQSKTSFLMNNEKSYFNIIKYDKLILNTITLNTITFLSDFSVEFTRKRKHNLRNIVHSDFCALCGSKSGTSTAKVKQENFTRTDQKRLQKRFQRQQAKSS